MFTDVPHAEGNVAVLECTTFKPFLSSPHVFLQSPVLNGRFGAWPAHGSPFHSRVRRS